MSSSLSFTSLGFPRARTESAVDPLLANNDAPSQVQADCVQYRIATLTRQMDMLVEHLAQVEEELKGYRSILSPIRRLPLEILGEIFKYNFPTFLNSFDRKRLRNLGRVCQRWRDALRSVPSLWKGVILGACDCRPRDSRKANRRHAGDYDSMVGWLGRAGGSPKGVIYSSHASRCRCVPGSRCLAINPTLVRLIKDGPPLDHLSLQLSGNNCFRSWVGALEPAPGSSLNPLRSIRSFSVEFTNDARQEWDDGDDPASSVFTLLPPVQALALYLPYREDSFDNGVDPSDCPIYIPPTVLNPLVSLTIRWDWEGRRLLDVLVHCTALEKFTLNLNRSQPFGGSLPYAPVVLGALQTIRIIKGGIRLLDFLRTPALVSLDLELAIDRADTITLPDQLKGFLQASEVVGRLRYLRICEMVGAPGTITLVLPPLSSLRHLVLDSSTATGYYFGPSSLRSINPRFPALRRLELLNLKRSPTTLTHEIQFLHRRATEERCMITVSYAKEPLVPTEYDLAYRIRAERCRSVLSVEVVPGVAYDAQRQLTL
ncbi:hypothetical protein D9611_014513 [Ephemerocybe angulata]|uniref:F-box domain-containing protein n=2 Tax=Ephemerocybe angulata TaxID=980116 RepID=A0A8H5BWX3_9AGAR|nr:hypothetical protein D9611_010395 [Tulosesus angulatus]KAF5334182.1 hypothetical protein D9611_014513 [Tulosesus angulatus]